MIMVESDGAEVSSVLVTGANGFLGSRVVASLLDDGYAVRATVRSAERGAELVEDLKRAGHEADRRIDVIVAQLDSDGAWADAADGVKFVVHTASPFPASAPTHEDEIIVPARDGALRVLRAARDRGVERVVMTSSFAAIGYSPKTNSRFTEDDWTDPRDRNQPYIKSKAVAERAAWDFIAREGGTLELSVVNPVGIFGPVLGPKLSTSVAFIKAMLDGSLQEVPAQHFGVVDVRDAAQLHLRAMTHPGAAGERFLAVADGPSLSFLEVAKILRESLGDAARAVPQKESASSSDGADPQQIPIISNAKAERVLGWRPRDARETIVDTATSLLDLRLV
jgi:nucleoside-diphosphate-sugar epimerase